MPQKLTSTYLSQFFIFCVYNQIERSSPHDDKFSGLETSHDTLTKVPLILKLKDIFEILIIQKVSLFLTMILNQLIKEFLQQIPFL